VILPAQAGLRRGGRLFPSKVGKYAVIVYKKTYKAGFTAAKVLRIGEPRLTKNILKVYSAVKGL
jgi:hypothetical protein